VPRRIPQSSLSGTSRTSGKTGRTRSTVSRSGISSRSRPVSRSRGSSGKVRKKK
jgi:hypothetical protein